MTSQMKTLLILNPAAGKGKGKKIFSKIHSLLKKNIDSLKVETSLYPGHIYKIGQNAIREGYQKIITIGGDGTPFELINGLYSSGKPEYEIQLGMIPSGTGNSFLRDFMDNPDEENCVRTILDGKCRQVDLIEFQYNKNGPIKQYCLNIMGIGLIADILKLTNERLKGFGPLGYSLAVLIRLFKGINNHFTLKADQQSMELKDSALAISNSKYTGGKMKMAPMAETDDGKVDIIVFKEVNRRDIINIFINVFKGNHIHHDRVEVFNAKEIQITADPQQLFMADGELLGETPLKIKVLPKELSILI
jgi:YegS/Rv2252/BmrU family lipid kinase